MSGMVIIYLPRRGLIWECNQTFFLSFDTRLTISQFISSILSGDSFRTLMPGPDDLVDSAGSHMFFMHEYTPTEKADSYAAYDILRAIGQGDIVGCILESATRLQCVMQNTAAAIS